jgi:hypothetical protein
MRSLRIVSCVGVLLIVAACGGSGGGGDGGAAVLSGVFKAARVSGDVTLGPTVTVTTFTGTGDADGLGSITFLGVDNDEGVVSPATGVTRRVTLGADGSLAIGDATDDFEHGWLGHGGDLAVAGSVFAGDEPHFLTLVRCWPGTATTASLMGSFHTGLFGHAVGVTTSYGTATADGIGNIALVTTAFNREGAILPGGGSSMTYTVAADGTTTVTDPVSTHSGGLLPGGGMLIASGATTSGDPPAIFVMLKTATSASLATLLGTYRVAGIAFDFSAPAFRSFDFTMTADGAGLVGISGVINEEGSISTEPGSAASYTVAADGGLQLNVAGTLRGAVSQDGRVGFLSGGTTAGSEPIFLVFVRQ